jgi:hypothetical protein
VPLDVEASSMIPVTTDIEVAQPIAAILRPSMKRTTTWNLSMEDVAEDMMGEAMVVVALAEVVAMRGVVVGVTIVIRRLDGKSPKIARNGRLSSHAKRNNLYL